MIGNVAGIKITFLKTQKLIKIIFPSYTNVIISNERCDIIFGRQNSSYTSKAFWYLVSRQTTENQAVTPVEASMIIPRESKIFAKI